MKHHLINVKQEHHNSYTFNLQRHYKFIIFNRLIRILYKLRLVFLKNSVNQGNRKDNSEDLTLLDNLFKLCITYFNST
jgi:hypothetical protein